MIQILTNWICVLAGGENSLVVAMSILVSVPSSLILEFLYTTSQARKLFSYRCHIFKGV